MDKVYESEKSSRRQGDEREDRDSSKDHHQDHDDVSVERPLLKRKERADSEERSDKGEKQRKENKSEKLQFEVNDQANEDEHISSNHSISMKEGSVPELLLTKSNAKCEPSSADHPHPNKVSLISTPDENKGASVIRSSEVPEKSSKDGTTSAAGKSDCAIVKANELEQKPEEVKEKQNKLPVMSMWEEICAVAADESVPSSDSSSHSSGCKKPSSDSSSHSSGCKRARPSANLNLNSYDLPFLCPDSRLIAEVVKTVEKFDLEPNLYDRAMKMIHDKWDNRWMTIFLAQGEKHQARYLDHKMEEHLGGI